MLNLNKSNFQSHSLQVVFSSPLLIYLSISLVLITSALLSYHGFACAECIELTQMESLVTLHDYIVYYFLIILFSISWILIFTIKNFDSSKAPISNKYCTPHINLIEWIWTIAPVVTILIISFPSFRLLYLIDEVTDAEASVITENHAWYLHYECSDFFYSDGDFIDLDSYLVPCYYVVPDYDLTPESYLKDGALKTEADNIFYIMLQQYLFEPMTSFFQPIQCSSPSKTNEAFNNMEVIVKAESSKDIINHPVPNLDWSSMELKFAAMDLKLQELRNNMNFMSDSRISSLKGELEDNFAQLNELSRKAFLEVQSKSYNIYSVFRDLSSHPEFDDLHPVLDKVIAMTNEDILKTDKKLHETDPIQYWDKQIKFANRVNNKHLHITKVYKDYVKDNDVLSVSDKTKLYGSISDYNITLTKISDADKVMFKKNIELCKILKEHESKKK